MDKYVDFILQTYNNYFYLLFFGIIFCETGLVITPFLPGDSLLFVVGTISASGRLNFVSLLIILIVATFLGDNTNFFIGKFIGKKLFKNKNSWIFNKKMLDKTHDFYARYATRTIIIARFIPIIRTFAPFIAGASWMNYKKFITLSIIAAILWITIFLGGGYLFGNIPLIKNHVSIIIILVMVISLLPALKIIFNKR